MSKIGLTGARQTGKTTLAKTCYRGLRYLNLDNIEEHGILRELRTAAWGRTVGPAVLDEAQKEPLVFDKVKSSSRREPSVQIRTESCRALLKWRQDSELSVFRT